jgi:uncharacterized membrane protein
MLKSPMISHALSFGVAVVAALGVAMLAPHWVKPASRVVAGYDVFAFALLAWYWFIALQRTAEAAGRRAAREDPGANAVVIVVLCAVGFGFFAALEILARGPAQGEPARGLTFYGIGLGGVVLGWLLIHTIFLFRYARLYYQDRDGDRKRDGGLIFPGGDEPSDLDFAYFSFVVGMTFQVSDVQISSPNIRRLVLGHAMISFAYNTAILALVVNVVSGFLH